MFKIQTKKITLPSPQALFMAGLLAALGLSITLLGFEARAIESSLDTYTDNAGGQQQMRVTRAPGERRPAIIFVHGGGWFSDGRTWGPDFQNRAAHWGYSSFRIKYRLMPGGVVEQLQDVLRAVRHVRSNADKYNIDPNRIAIWGDSAGGSLSMRAAATGTSGLAAAVGWSAPTNAFRDMFNSPEGFIDGMFHSRCFGEYFPPVTTDIINFVDGNTDAIMRLASNQPLSLEESLKLLDESLRIIDLTLDQLPGTSGKLQKSPDNIVSVSNNVLNGREDKKSNYKNTDSEELQKRLSKLQAQELEKIALAMYEFNRSADSVSAEHARTVTTVSLVQMGLNEISAAQSRVVQEKANSGSSNTPGLITRGNSKDQVSINSHQISADKIAQCIDDFVQLSPALFASPRTPPSFLAVASNERLVNAQDAYQMRDKLRSMGVRSEALVLPGDRHMGYDERAEVPSFQFLNSILRP